jgi:hypothetical protein
MSLVAPVAMDLIQEKSLLKENISKESFTPSMY